jgi:hypothetical protein
MIQIVRNSTAVITLLELIFADKILVGNISESLCRRMVRGKSCSERARHKVFQYCMRLILKAGIPCHPQLTLHWKAMPLSYQLQRGCHISIQRGCMLVCVCVCVCVCVYVCLYTHPEEAYTKKHRVRAPGAKKELKHSQGSELSVTWGENQLHGDDMRCDFSHDQWHTGPSEQCSLCPSVDKGDFPFQCT